MSQHLIFTAEDDFYHKLSDDPYETETNWWSFNIPERKMGGWIHNQYYPNRKTCTWRVFVWDDRGMSPTDLAYYRKVDEAPMSGDPDLTDISFPGGGYSLKMLEPGMKYQLGYSDPARGFAMDFVHTGVHRPHRFEPGEPPFMQTPHFDQLGHVEGTLRLHGETIAIDGVGVRDRTWGPRGGPYQKSRKKHPADAQRVKHPGGPLWRQIERERGRGRIEYIYGHSEDFQTGFLGFVRMQDADASGWAPMNTGWLLKDGVFQPLDKTRSRMLNFRDPVGGWNSHMLVDLADTTGRTMEAEGISLSRLRDGGMYQLMRWEFDGKVGWGEDQDVWIGAGHFPRMLDALRGAR
ncbi:hypothetical protein CVO77_03995 [Sphingopyxis lindanitolerans]|uniref:DUF7065 domain-containing protein n=1 Tax=Sphingopyxis lindanitolerans TaxID=2054227 RepID=A0A2S8B5V3_9SPHN|nr:hypothetical protein [Sphingopyxis lindanitolerans]PQM27737.1 hypothetical protein CVO77_03995 [Sphingopyxis lindanitolerans]